MPDDLRLSYAGTGAVTLQVDSASQTASASAANAPAQVPITATHEVHYRQSLAGKTPVRGLTVSIGDVGNAFVRAPARLGYLKMETVTAVDGRKISIAMDDDEHTAEALIGAEVTVWRITDGVLAMVRQSKVVAANIGAIYFSGDAGDAAAGGNNEVMYSQATGFALQLGNFFLPNRQLWAGVAAVDGAAQHGAIAWAGVTPTNTALAAAVDNTAGAIDAGQEITAGGALAAPAGLTATLDPGGHRRIDLAWDPVATAAGYVPFHAWQDPATIPGLAVGEPSFRYVELEDDGGAAVQPGDFYVLRNRFGQPSLAMVGTRAGRALSIYGAIFGRILAPEIFDGSIAGVSARYVEFDADEPAGSTPGIGEHYLQLDISGAAAAGDIEIMREQWHDGPDQTGYHVLKVGDDYRLYLWAYASRAGLALKIDAQIPGYAQESVSLAPGWQFIERVYSPTGVGTSVGRLYLHVVGDGSAATFRLAQCWLGRDEVAPGAWPSELTVHGRSGWGVRIHSFVKPNTRPYWVSDLISPYGTGAYGDSLHAYLQNCADHGMNPHLQIEPILDPAEWDFVYDYLAAPVASGRAGALRRQELGRTAPWLSAFEWVDLEVGNEGWNGLAEFLNPPGATDASTAEVYSSADVHGFIFEFVINRWRASPYWDESKTGWRFSGWGNNGYGITAVARISQPIWTGIANYNGGWEEGQVAPGEDVTVFQKIISRPEYQSEVAVVDQLARIEALGRSDVELFIYEGGLGYGSDSGIDLEVTQGSIAGAIATLDAFLMQAHHEARSLSFFTWGNGDGYTSGSPPHLGGGARPAFQIAQMTHEQLGSFAAARALPVLDRQAPGYDRQGNAVTMNACRVYEAVSASHPGEYWIVAINRDTTRTVPLAVLGPKIPNVQSCTVYPLTGDYRRHNKYQPGWRLAKNVTVAGDGQSGTTLAVDNLFFDIGAGDTFTINNVAGNYTIASVVRTGRSAVITTVETLASSPANDAKVTFDKVVDGFAPDELCVPIDLSAGISVPVPDTELLIFDDGLGAEAGGIGPLNGIIVRLSAAPGTPVGTLAVAESGADTVAGTGGGAGTSGTLAVVESGDDVVAGSDADVVAPVIDSASYSAGVLSLTLTEASGAATLVLAMADLPEDPVFAVGGGWTGSVYDTDAWPVTAGAIDLELDLATTPAGPREATLYAYDAAGRLSEPVRLSIEVLAPIAGTLAVVEEGDDTVAGSGVEPSTLTFTALQVVGDGHSAGETVNMSGVTEGSLLVAFVSERGGGGKANLSITDSGSAGYTALGGYDNELLDGLARCSVMAFAKIAGAADAGTLNVTGACAGGIEVTVSVMEIAVTGGAFAGVMDDAAFAGSGPAGNSWIGVSSGAATSTGGDRLVIRGGFGRQGPSVPVNASVGMANEVIVPTDAAANQMVHLLGYETAGQGSGAYSATLSDPDDFTATEGIVMTMVLKGSA